MQVAQGQVIVTVCALVQAAHLVSAHPAAHYASAQDGLGPLQLALVVYTKFLLCSYTNWTIH